MSAPNRITTTRYTVVSFVPQFLYLQFRSYMNLYFALVATLQLWPAIAPVPPLTAWLPIIVMLAIAATKEVTEEIFRWRSDYARNHQLVTVLRWSEHGVIAARIPREQVTPGHIVRINGGEEAPCDMVALQVQGSDSAEDVWLDTSGVDGESALQRRQVVSEWTRLSLDHIMRASLAVEPEPPNARMGSFDGVLRWGALERVWGTPLSHRNFVEQASRLRLADELVGIAVYVGSDTRASCADEGQTVKRAAMEDTINGITVKIAIVQVCAVVLALVLGWVSPVASQYPPHQPLLWVVMPLRMFLLTAPLLPISLRVTVEMTRAWVAHQVARDCATECGVVGQRVVVRSSAVMDDAGQVECAVFDKTGTLAENIMRFRGCVAGGRVIMRQEWSSEENEDKEKEGCEEEEGEAAGVVGDGTGGAARGLATALALCHSVAVRHVAADERHPEGIVYAGPSPDEETLVEAAALGGVTLEEQFPATATMPPRVVLRSAPSRWHGDAVRDQKVLRAGSGCRVEAHVLAEIPFSSDRKRMSVLVQFLPYQSAAGRDNQKEAAIQRNAPVWVLSKGADDVMMRRLRPLAGAAEVVDGPCVSDEGSTSVRDDAASRSDTMRAIEAFSRRGWRTLVVACRSIAPEAAESWVSAWQQTFRDGQVARREVMQAAMAREIEGDLVLLGGTAVEDALQAGAPEMLSSLLAANVRVWMATGDRTTSARQVGMALRLLPPTATVLELTEESTAGDRSPSEAMRSSSDDNTSDPAGSKGSTPPKNDMVLLHSVSGALRARAGRTSTPARGRLRRAVHSPSSLSSASRPSEGSQLHVLPPPPISHHAESLADRFVRRAEALVRDARRIGPGGDGAPNPCALVVDGVALAWLWDAERDCALPPLQALLSVCSPVVACRTVPAQKAGLVRAAAQLGFRTMAVGDGANDCAMIHEAKVGVGVIGREGSQASRVADIAVPSVAVLPTILFVHGRAAVIRISLIALFSCYKSMLLVALQVAAGVWSGWSGTSFVDHFFLMTFHTLYTAPPLFVLAWFALDASPECLREDPRRYRETQSNVWLSDGVLERWLVRGVLQAAVILLACRLALPLAATTVELSSAAFAAMLSALLITLSAETPRVTFAQLSVTLGCYAVFWTMLMIREPLVVLQGASWWLAFALASCAALLVGPVVDQVPSWRPFVEEEPHGTVVATHGDTLWRRLRRAAMLRLRGTAPRLLPL